VLSCGLLKGFKLSIIIIFDYCNRRESCLASCHVCYPHIQSYVCVSAQMYLEDYYIMSLGEQ
jgi:hypothetical protein